jgi:hypothetical protein
MSTPDQPQTPPLTRRQLRELRNTASTPVITPEEAQADADAARAEEESSAPVVAAEGAPAPVAEAESTSDSVIEAEEPSRPVAPAALDLDAEVHPVTRRQARHLAQLRTGSVDVVDPENENEPETESAGEPEIDPVEELDSDAAPHPDASPEAVVAEEHPEDHSEAHVDADAPAPDPHDDVTPREHATPAAEEEPEPAHVVAPALGAQLLEEGAAPVDLPPSFDHLLTRGGSGSSSAPNALILSQTPETGSLSVPILGTGELIITGSYALPESYGSNGTTPGTSDGKDLDAALLDGELPPASSPTPIAASAAISTIKSADDIIRPPAPEKGSRLIMTLAICAGALGLALATVLILTVVNGYF